MAKFKVGDVVMLKSGGPKMTVYELAEDGRARCYWFSTEFSGYTDKADFHEECLVLQPKQAAE